MMTPAPEVFHPTTNRPVLLIATPYSALRTHGHAADDLAKEMLVSLSERFSVHVYAPGQPEMTTRDYGRGSPVTFHEASTPRPSVVRAVGIYPAALRKDWSRRNTRELCRLRNELSPDFLHVEYLQPAEIAKKIAFPFSITLHDITSRVLRQRWAEARGLDRFYRLLEYLRVKRLEASVTTSAARVFTLSDRDKRWAAEHNRHVSKLTLGIAIPEEAWTPPTNTRPSFVFSGAMWRDANSSVARYLIDKVMPLVRQVMPDARLRIVGVRPPAWLTEMNDEHGVTIVGHVPSLESEYLRADAVLAPSLIDAGVLIKAMRGLACGAPLVTNSRAAEPLGLINGYNAIIAENEHTMADALVRTVTEPQWACDIGARGREYAVENLNWERYATEFVQGVEPS